MITSFRNLKIRAKLVSVTFLLVMLPLLPVAYLSTDHFSKALRRASDEDLEHLVRNIYSMCKVQQEMIQAKVISDLKVARELLNRHGDKIVSHPEQKIHFDAVNQMTRERLSFAVPLWKMGDILLSGNNDFVDEFQDLVGESCAIFQRIEGNHLLCISGNITGKEGKRGIGTFIPSESPVVKAILTEGSFRGRAYMVDDWYIAAYESITEQDGTVIGALCVGIREQSAQSLKGEIKGLRVGDTGYVYIMDSLGNLKIHPAKEGENIIHSKDSSGFEYILAMIKDCQLLREEDVGTIRYPWINPELGEKKPRQKINKYIYFRPWDWIIVAGSYEEEIYQALYQTERFIILIVLMGLALVFILTITLSKVLTRPVQELTEITTKMAEGDLSQRVKIHSEDEIGVLGTSFNRMIGQIEHYTKNLEKMVEDRTRDLKGSEEKYRELSRFLNSILDSATEYAIMAFDLHGKIIEFNRGAEKVFDWKKEEVINKENIRITITKEDLERDIEKEMQKRTRSEGLCDIEMTRIKRNGARFPAHTTITAITDPEGRVSGFVEIIRDITKRKTLEKELRETKEFLENVMESSVDGILTTDLRGKIIYQNRAMEEILYYPREEVLGAHISQFYVKGIQQAREIMALLRETERVVNYEMEALRKDGTQLSILTSLFLIRDEDGQVIGTAGIFKDITEQKKLEDKIKATQTRLVEASKMRALGELVSGVAHELNNPLMASQTILHVIFNNLHENCPNRERLELIRRCNNRIERIVEHLREFSRQTKPEFKELDINLPIQNALMITEQQIVNDNISIMRNLSVGLPSVMGDSNQLEQVFLNLISNARDAMADVSGQKELTIVSELAKDDGLTMVAVMIKDTGDGIPQENLNKVFEPFFSTKPVGKGTGLGLSLCFGIVEAHEGRIEMNSQQGKGTEVKVLLPVKDAIKE